MVKYNFEVLLRYGYDCLGNVTLEERVIAEGVRSIIHYAYNKNGWRIQKTEERVSGKKNGINRRVQCACNVFGKPVYEKATDAENVCIFILMRKACLSKDFLCKNPFEK